MKDEEFDALQARIDVLVETWGTLLGLDYWEITRLFYRDSGVYEKEHGDCAASCSAKWPYLMVTLNFNMQALLGLPDEKIEEIVVHECCHALVREMQDEDADGDHVERVVTQIARAFIRTRNRERDDE